tara:strand:+ start:350 stop:1441 length:1092 start_codon:yes stop_codon:yes gene_type:complete
MAFRKKRTKDISTEIPLSRLATPAQISSYIKKIVNAAQYDSFETEAFEVSKVLLNDEINNGAVLGTFINEPSQPILGGVVLPLMPNISNIPLIGEHVVVVEYNGQHYYTSIINRKNNPNENSIPGAAVSYEGNPKYGKTFERKDIRRVEVSEGEVVYEGRFGQSIKLGCDHIDNLPMIKIRVGQQTPPEQKGAVVKENIERDGSSIYLLDNGLPFNADIDEEKFDGEQITGKKILIKSNGIFISGRSNIKLRAVNDINITTPVFNIISTEGKPDIKLGSIETAELQPVVRGDDLKTFLDEVIDMIVSEISGVGTEVAKIVGAPTGPIGSAAGLTVVGNAAALKVRLKSKINTSPMLSKNVKTV